MPLMSILPGVVGVPKVHATTSPSVNIELGESESGVYTYFT